MPAIAWTTIKDAIHTWIRVTSGLSADRIRWAGQNAPEPSGSADAWILLGRMTWTNPGGDWSQFESNPLVFADKTVTLNVGTDTGTSTAHGLLTRDGPFHLATTGSLAGTGLSINKDYWTVLVDANTLKFATSFPNAHNGVFVDILGAGTGTHTIVDTPDTRRAGAEVRELVRGARRVSFTVQCFPAQPTNDVTDAVAILSEVSAKSGLGAVIGPLQDAGIGLLSSGEPQPVDGVLNSVYFEPRATMTVVFATTSEVEGIETIIDYVNVDADPGADFSIDLTEAPNEP